jgi:hypothetical protein
MRMLLDATINAYSAATHGTENRHHKKNSIIVGCGMAVKTEKEP